MIQEPTTRALCVRSCNLLDGSDPLQSVPAFKWVCACLIPGPQVRASTVGPTAPTTLMGKSIRGGQCFVSRGAEPQRSPCCLTDDDVCWGWLAVKRLQSGGQQVYGLHPRNYGRMSLNLCRILSPSASLHVCTNGFRHTRDDLHSCYTSCSAVPAMAA